MNINKETMKQSLTLILEKIKVLLKPLHDLIDSAVEYVAGLMFNLTTKNVVLRNETIMWKVTTGDLPIISKFKFNEALGDAKMIMLVRVLDSIEFSTTDCYRELGLEPTLLSIGKTDALYTWVESELMTRKLP